MNPLTTAGTVVIGSGPAGAAAAAAIARRGGEVLLIEGGAARERAQDRDLNEGDEPQGVWGHEPLGLHRRRVLGGASTAWGGRCIPLDPVDFEQRDWIPGSGWPIPYAEFQRWFGEAAGLLQIPDTAFSRAVADPLFAKRDGISGAPIELWSPPTHFGTALEALVRTSPGIRVEQSLHVVRIETEGDRVTGILAARGDERVRITGARYVLATGGLENARLLLASRLAGGLPALGKYYMSHVFATHVHYTGPALPAATGFFKVGRSYARHRWQLTPEAQAEHGVGNVIGFIARPPAHGLAMHLDPLSALVSAMKLLRRHARTPRALLAARGDLATYARVLLGADAAFWRHTVAQTLRRRAKNRLPMLLPPRTAPLHFLTVQAEHLPHPDSRVTLADAVDRYGVPLLRTHIDFERDDFRTVEVFHAAMNRYLGEQGYRPSTEPDAATRVLASDMYRAFNTNAHHIGTTRMGEDPATSVVDADSRVHGVDNLYVAGASVFPTSGHANPTFSLVALACRLGAHLAER